MTLPNPTIPRLEVFVTKTAEGFRFLTRARSLPRPLRAFFDENGESPSLSTLDFDELGRLLRTRGASVEHRTARSGGIELSAEGEGAIVLARWMASAFASGVR